MASINFSARPLCIMCNGKSGGIVRCEGCFNVYCRKHMNEHRNILSHQLDEAFLERDTLQQLMCEKIDQFNKNLSVLKQVDQWEINSIAKIKRIANETREEIRKIASFPAISNKLHELGKSLQHARNDDDYVETDLRNWATVSEKLRLDINAFSPTMSIRENTQEILISMIHLDIQERQPEINEKFGEFYGNIRIEHDRLLARHVGPHDNKALVRGTSEYSIGKHKIRFLFHKGDLSFITSFNVVSKLMPINGTGSDLGIGFYGWSSNDNVNCPGTEIVLDKNVRDMKGQSTVQIELELDCDNRKISYVNLLTKIRRELNVNIELCPFPWQVRFYLYGVGDYVQILP